METTPKMSQRPTGHGTHVAGTILGRDTGDEKSILGVAPEAKMFAYRVLGAGGAGTWDAILAGLEQATYDKPDIINMSLGANCNTPVCLLSLAVNNIMLAYDDIVFMIAAGNNGPEGYTIGSPATSTMAIAVASTDKIDDATDGLLNQISRFSSRGPVSQSFEIKPNITANGSYVFSAVPLWSTDIIKGIPNNKYSGAYAYKKGTSMAAPHASGAAALLIEYSRRNTGKAWDAKTIKARMMNTATPIEDSVFSAGAGYLDVYAAAHSDTVVYVTQDKVPTQIGILYEQQKYMETDIGSFNFGGHFTTSNTTAIEKMLSARIVNQGDSERNYTLDYGFTNNPDNSASITFNDKSISVKPGSETDFTTSLTMKEDCEYGIYEGFVYVRDTNSNTLVAALPFAFVTERLMPPKIVKTLMHVGTAGQHYEAEIQSECNAPPLTNWQIESGYLPPGLVLERGHNWGMDASGEHKNACAVINGVPSETGSFTFTVRAENEAGYDIRDLTIIIR